MIKLILVSLTLFMPFVLFAQAQLPAVADVTGALVSEKTDVTIHVDQLTGNDANDGFSEAAAVRTLKTGMAKAVAELKNGRGVLLLIHPGIYRESLGSLTFGTGRTRPFVIQGTDAEAVVISGADVFTDWHPYQGRIYQTNWPHDFGNNYHDWKSDLIAHRCEMVFVNGQPLRQVILETYSKSGNQFTTYTGFRKPEDVLTPGTFGVAERSENGDRLFIYPPEGVELSSAVVEIAVRHSAMTFVAKDGLVLRNLTVQHFANRFLFPWTAELALAFSGTTNVLLDNCRFYWNNGAGTDFSFAKVTVRNCDFSWNGGSGFSTGNGCVNFLLEDTQTHFNGWRPFFGGDTDWFAGGVKHHQTRKQIVRRHRAIGNLTNGFWYDIHCKDIYIEDLVVLFSYERGLTCEISYGPFQVVKSLFAFNRSHDVQYYTLGEFTFERNIVYGKTLDIDRAAVDWKWYPRPGDYHWELDKFSPGHISVNNNIFSAAENKQWLWDFNNNPSDPQYKEGYLAADNMYWHDSGSDAKRFFYGDWDGNTNGNFKGWLSWIGKARETAAQWLDPQFENPENLDFRLKESSPLKTAECSYHAVAIDAKVLEQTRQFFAWVGLNYGVPDGTIGGATNCDTKVADNSAPHAFSLAQNYPNPFNATTTIEYALPHPRRVTLQIFDVRGRLIETLLDEFQSAGTYTVRFAAHHLPSGFYFYKLTCGELTSVRKMTLLR